MGGRSENTEVSSIELQLSELVILVKETVLFTLKILTKSLSWVRELGPKILFHLLVGFELRNIKMWPQPFQAHIFFCQCSINILRLGY